MSESLYRFMPFEAFIALIQRKELVLVNADKWEDPYEGFVVKMLQNPSGAKKIHQALLNHGIGSEDAGVALYIVSQCAMTIFMQSWTKLSESDALWRIYSHNNRSIRIEVERDKFFQLNNVQLREIAYVSQEEIMGNLAKIFSARNVNLSEIYTVKRNAFEHEREVRLISSVDLDFLPTQRWPFSDTQLQEMANEMIKAGQITEEEGKTFVKNASGGSSKSGDTKSFSFAHIAGFIKSVKSHPLSPDWFDTVIKRLCEENDLNYEGRSDLYTFIY